MHRVRQEASYYTSTTTPLVNGTVFTPQAFVHIHWGWISLLSLQLGFASLFLLLTVLSTNKSRMQVLKGSSLATLCALRPDVREEMGGIGGFDRLRRKARRIKVRLERGEDGTGAWLAIADKNSGRRVELFGNTKGEEVVAEEEEEEVAGYGEEYDPRRQGRIFGDYDTAPTDRMALRHEQVST
jgi:hypothetical protein